MRMVILHVWIHQKQNVVEIINIELLIQMNVLKIALGYYPLIVTYVILLITIVVKFQIHI